MLGAVAMDGIAEAAMGMAGVAGDLAFLNVA
jgi:hypothetical protein